MKVIFVGAGPGDPELLTIKAKRLLESANICIYAGSLVSPDIIKLIPEEAEVYDSAKMSLQEMVGIYISAKKKSIDVIRLHSGDPSIYGAIREQISELDKHEIVYEVVPGVSSFQASAAAICAELTAPEISQTIILTRTSGRTPLPESQELKKLAVSGATLCIFLSASKIRKVAEMLIKYYGKDCPAAAVFRASWPDQKIYRNTLSEMVRDNRIDELTKTTMFIVGWALSSKETYSKLYDSGFSHDFRRSKSR